MLVQFLPMMMAQIDTPRLNEIFTLLSNQRRRFVLYYLTFESDEVDSNDLAERIAVVEANNTSAVSDEFVRSVKVSLSHIHLPKLADAGFITCNRTQGTIEREEVDDLTPFLEKTALLDGYPPTVSTD